jgi:hypothetical protein
MKARQMIEGGTFGPDALKLITEAFDQAWMRIAPRYHGDSRRTEAARVRLAEVVMGLAPTHGGDVAGLAQAALARMDVGYEPPPPRA